MYVSVEMQTKLTLRMDDRLIANAKEYAASAGKSLSQVVAEYLAAVLSAGDPPSMQTPTVSRLRGCLKDTSVDVEDYQTYLEDKYL